MTYDIKIVMRHKNHSERSYYTTFQVYLALINTFNHLPLCAIIGGRVLCMHGGLSPHIESLEDIEQVGGNQSFEFPCLDVL